jgi:hypothetical protein
LTGWLTAVALVGLAAWLGGLTALQLRASRAANDRLTRAIDALEAAQHGPAPEAVAPMLRITRPTPYSDSGGDWYEIEVLVSNGGPDEIRDVAVTAFVEGRPVGEPTEPRTIPPGRGVSFRPRMVRTSMLDGQLSLHAGNGRVQTWWRGRVQ